MVLSEKAYVLLISHPGTLKNTKTHIFSQNSNHPPAISVSLFNLRKLVPAHWNGDGSFPHRIRPNRSEKD
jgi:hypothetical protein